MIRLIKGAEIYAPQYQGKQDILICGGKIAKIAPSIDLTGNCDIELIDADGCKAVPGFIDVHVHITGGGGEQGPASRVPESQISQFISSGVTTCVGLLGTDGITRSLPNLLAKCRALNEEGITCLMLTGSYRYPSATLTRDVVTDICYIPECIGAKLAISDHRSSDITYDELVRLATEVRSGGLLSGKAGILHMHTGTGARMLELVLRAAKNTDIPIKTFYPTHLARSEELISQAAEFAKMGGMIDFTANDPATSAKPACASIARCIDAGAPTENITLSSDSFGSLPRFDAAGNCIGLTYVLPDVLLKTVKSCISNRGMSLETALGFVTKNPAKAIGLENTKGCIKEHADADILLLGDSLDIRTVIAKGKTAYKDGECIIKGRFE